MNRLIHNFKVWWFLNKRNIYQNLHDISLNMTCALLAALFMITIMRFINRFTKVDGEPWAVVLFFMLGRPVVRWSTQLQGFLKNKYNQKRKNNDKS